MKVISKTKKTDKGKGPVKDGSTGTQTITSMFKKQMAAKVQATNTQSPAKSVSSDDDVKIIKVETQSPYFSDTGNPNEDKRPKIRRKLSLRRSANFKDDIEKSDTDTDCSNKKTIKEEGLDVQLSQKENSSLKPQSERKLRLRKRKSDTVEESECKKNKSDVEIISGENKEQQHVKNESKISYGDNSENFKEREKSGFVETLNGDRKDMKGQHSAKNKDVPMQINGHEKRKNSESGSSHQLPPKSELKILPDTKPISEICKTETDVKLTRDSSISSCSKSNMENSLTSTDVQSETGDNDTEKDKDLENEEDKNVEFRTPYYLENFRTVLITVFEDVNNVKLFNSGDMDVISTFNALSEAAQKLYLRLFCRKWVWLPMSKIKYPGIAEDLQPIVQELVDKYFFTTDECLHDLRTTLKLLSGGDVKTIGKMYHITSQNKVDTIELLMKKTKQNTIGSMFKMAGNSAETVMLNRAKKLLGRCVCVAEGPRNVFARTMMLFSLTDTVLDEDSSGQTLQLFQMLRVNIGEVTFPQYRVNKQIQIFPDRDALIRFCEASLLEFDILTKLERNKYTEAYSIYEEAVKQYDNLTKNKQVKEFDTKLPIFLRPYTACGVYTRALNQGVEILQRRKNYQSAVDLLKRLLSQKCYCQHYRGHWWERLALNYDTHLKQQDLALKAAEDGLADKLVKTGRRLALYQRAEKICTASKSKYKARMKDFHHEQLLELPTVTIDGQTLSDCIQGQKYKFMIQYSQGEGQTDTDDIAFCAVEEVVLDHYKHNGFTDGIHAEGSVISCLFGLFFWDIMFMDVPDVFHSPYQAHPLDLHTEEFYSNRKKHIDERLQKIQDSSVQDLHDMMCETWEKHEGTMCSGLNWERFNSLQHVQGLVECIGGKKLSGILGRYAKDPRHTRSGFPDLTLWNVETKHFKICEVKGPGDKLSHKQILWLDFLLKLGVDAEVCHVKAVGSKRLKKTTSNV